MPTQLATPFGAESLVEVPLTAPPLVRAVIQVKFPQLTALHDQEIAHTFNDKIKDLYPVLKTGQELTFTLGPDGATASRGAAVYRSSSIDQDWNASLSPSVLTLDTSNYSTRRDIVERIDYLVDTLGDVVGALPRAEKVGVRYINLISDSAVIDNIESYIRPQLHPGGNFPREDVTMTQSVSHFAFSGDVWEMQVRSGLLSPGAVLDPTMRPTDVPVWLLDIDTTSMEPSRMVGVDIGAVVGDLAERAYRFFRWAVTEKFFEVFGAEEVDDGQR